MSLRTRVAAGALSLAVGATLALAAPGVARAETTPAPPQPWQGTWNVDYDNFGDTLAVSSSLTVSVKVPENIPGHYPTQTTVCNYGTTGQKVGFDNWATTGPTDNDTWFINPALEEPYEAGWPITPLTVPAGGCVTRFITASRMPNLVHFIHPVTGKRYDFLPATEWDGIPDVWWPRSYGSTGVYGDMTGDSSADVLAVNSTNQWRTYTSAGRPTLYSAGSPTNAPPGCCINFVSKVPDLDRNQMSDYLWRGTSSGLLVMSPVMGKNRFGQQRVVGWNWNSMSIITVVPDVTGDLNPEIYARAADGRLARYTLHRNGPVTFAGYVGHGWGGITRMVSIGDASGDGIADLLAVRSDGALVRYTLSRSGGISSTTVIGHGWQTMKQVTSAGDLDRNGRADLVAIRSDGRLMHYNHLGNGRFAPAVQIGHGWQTMKFIV